MTILTLEFFRQEPPLYEQTLVKDLVVEDTQSNGEQ